MCGGESPFFEPFEPPDPPPLFTSPPLLFTTPLLLLTSSSLPLTSPMLLTSPPPLLSSQPSSLGGLLQKSPPSRSLPFSSSKDEPLPSTPLLSQSAPPRALIGESQPWLLISSTSPSSLLSTTLLRWLKDPQLWVMYKPLIPVFLENVDLKVFEATVFCLIIINDPIKLSEVTSFAVMQGSTDLGRQLEFPIFGATHVLLCLKLDLFCSCLRCFAALCRSLLWFKSLQPLVYLPLYTYVESLLLTSSDFHVVWVSVLIVSTFAMDRSHYFIRVWWCFLVALPPLPPVPPDPPDFILAPLCLFVFWIRDYAVLTLSSSGDMSFVTALISTACILPVTQGSILSAFWNVWNLTGLCSIARFIALRLKLLSPHLPLYEDPLPLYEDRLPLYEDLLPLYEDPLPLYEDLVTLPLYEDLALVYREILDSGSLFASFTEFTSLLDSPFVLNGWDTRDVIKGSSYRCLIALVAIIEMGNCALVAVLISGVRSNTHGFILLNNSIVDEIRGLLRDFSLFKCFVVSIFLCFQVYLVVFYVSFAMTLWNIYSFYGA